MVFLGGRAVPSDLVVSDDTYVSYDSVSRVEGEGEGWATPTGHVAWRRV